MADNEAKNVAQDEKQDTHADLEEDKKTFQSLGVVDVLCEACEGLKWKEPTKIQRESIPIALAGNDVIGLAETGSGKTGAFALPILQQLLENPQRLFALVLTPTRELAFQISEQFEALGSTIGKYLYYLLQCENSTFHLDIKLFTVPKCLGGKLVSAPNFGS